MRRADWTPLVLVTATVAVSVVVGVMLSGSFFSDALVGPPGPSQARRHLAPEVEVWVGRFGADVTAVLAPVWGEPGPDRAHDARLNEELALPGDEGLAWYQLLVFNTSGDERRVRLGDGALSIRTEAETAEMRSVAGLVARGAAKPSLALRRVLEAHGALRDEVVVPAGLMADLLVGFSRRVELDTAVEVASADGDAFRRRPMSRRDLDALVARPEAAAIGDL